MKFDEAKIRMIARLAIMERYRREHDHEDGLEDRIAAMVMALSDPSESEVISVMEGLIRNSEVAMSNRKRAERADLGWCPGLVRKGCFP